jgi:hypothetical protein
MLPGDILDVFANIILLENVENPGFGEPCFLHE